jgi:protein YibB
MKMTSIFKLKLFKVVFTQNKMHTVVTGFFNIGREYWEHHQRPLEDYLNNFKNLLSLNADMIIFVENVFVPFVEEHRRKVNFCRTTIVPTEIEELRMFRYIDRIISIQNSETYAINHPNRKAPEICKPLYNIVTCSKMDLMTRATEIDKISEWFIWLDAGYCHGTIELSKLLWNPSRIFEHKDKICVVALQSLEIAKDEPIDFFNQYIDICIGGFFAGSRDTLLRMKEIYYDFVVEMFNLGIKDDDQFYTTMLVKRFPSLFKVYIDNWYGPMYWK